MISLFFDKKVFFYLARYTKFYATTRKKIFESSMAPFLQMYAICMSSIFSKT